MMLIIEMLLLGALARFAYRVPRKRKQASDNVLPQTIQEKDNTTANTKSSDEISDVINDDLCSQYVYTNNACTGNELSIRL